MIEILKPDTIKFNGNVAEILTEINRIHPKVGDILILRFNPLNVKITNGEKERYKSYLHRAAGGKVAVMAMPQGMSVELIEAKVLVKKMAEIAAQAQAQIDAEEEDAST